jgi:protein-L-isoaspartate(D-aspartate) O-methyltransferase
MRTTAKIYACGACLLFITIWIKTAQAQDFFMRYRMDMVETQIKARGVSDERTLEAMRAVPRHKFISKLYAPLAYSDQPLPIGEGQTISQPYIVAFMTEQLKLKPGCRVLEVGTGSGYQAAVLSILCQEVYTIEIIPSLGEGARKTLEELGYKNVAVKIGDGYLGWEKHAPFDGIIVTAAAPHIPQPLIDQLKAAGRMIIPIGEVFDVQDLVLVEKREDGSVTTQKILPVRFVPLTGGH